MSHPVRNTIATSKTSAAPIQIILFTLPIWGASMILTLFMPMTGIITSIIMAVCLLVLPFKARRGLCPACEKPKTLPFSGFGNRCKGCGKEIVLRGSEFHLLEARTNARIDGSGRG